MTPSSSSEPRAKIFILDDSRTFLAVARVHLEAEGFVVLTFDSPLGISREIIRHQPDMVIVDVNMPSISGDKVCQLVRSSSFARSVTVLLHSSLPESELGRLAIHCGADGFVPKSSDSRVLIEAVHKHLSCRRRLFVQPSKPA